MATTTLNLYWDLASLDATTRHTATVTLIRTLADFQVAHEKTLQSSGLPALADSEETLDQLCASDVSYAVRRLLRGLPSSRQGARQGFSLALTELLSVMECITTKLVLDLLCQYTERAGGMSGEETRDMLFGRLFGIMAIVGSGLMGRSDATCTDDVIRMVDLVAEIAGAKSYLNEVCYHVIINMLPTVDKMDDKSKVMAKILELFVRENMANVDEVNLTMAIQQQMSDVDLSRPFTGWASENVFDRANLQHMASIVREVPMGTNESQVDWTPQLHSIWDRLFMQLLHNNSNNKDAFFHEFWSIVVDGNLFSQQASHGRKYWGFQVINKVLPELSTDQMPLVFTENFMRTFINNLSSDVRFLNKAARQTAMTIQQVAEQNKQVGFAVVSQLIGKYGDRQFDRITRTKTVENLLATMDSQGIRNYLTYLARLFVQNQQDGKDSDEVSDRTVETQREWAMNQMLLLVTHPKTPKEESWINDVIQFIVVYTFFDVKPKASTKKSPKKSKAPAAAVDYLNTFETAPTPALTEPTRTMCKAKFQALVLSLSKLPPTNKKTEIGQLKTRRWNGSTNDGRLWADVIYNHYQHLLSNKNLVLHGQVSDDADALKTIKATLKVIDGLKAQIKKEEGGNASDVPYGFEILFFHVLLHSLLDQEEGAGLLGDLLNCFEKMEQQNKPAKKKSNKKKAVVEEQDDGEPEPIEVIVDILLSFLTSASPMLKGITEHVFELFSPLVTKQAMENLINIITTNENKDGGDELFGGDEDDSEMEEDDDVELVDQDESDDDDVMEIDQDEGDEQNGMVDEELRRKVEEAMRSQGILGDDSEEEELLDDDAMEAFDEKLAEIFKQKKMEKQDKKTMQESVVHFKNNVMDLLIIFARKNPTSPLLLGTIVPLLEIVQSTKAKATTMQFVNKVESYLKNKLGKATDVPTDFDDATLLDIVASVHTFAIETTASGGGSKPRSDMCSQLLLFLRKCIVGTGADVTIQSLQTDKKTKSQAQLLKKYMALYRDSLDAFLSKKTNQLHTSYFAALLQRFPQTCWEPFMQSTLVPHLDPTTCGNAFRHSYACQWTGLLIQQCVAKKNKSVDDEFTTTLLPTIVQHIQASAQALLADAETTTEKTNPSSSEKLKSLMKLAGLVDKTMLRLGSKITTWDTSLFTTLSTDKTFGTPLVRTTCKSILDRS